jgi:formylglycine-generating enzyme required for sulfatase activity
MRPALQELAAFDRASDAVKLAMAREIATSLGDAFSSADELTGARRLPVLVHAPTDERFVVVPGGSFEMGMREADLDELSEYVDWTASAAHTIDQMKALCRPLRRVEVAPFLCAIRPLARDRIRTLLGGRHTRENFARADAVAFARDLGLRLPSEAELEWLAREGGRLTFVDDGARIWEKTRTWPTVGGFGVEDSSEGQWAADDWHPSYEGAPSTSAPWREGEDCGVFRGELPSGPDQHRSEIVFGLACHRNRGARPDDRDSDHAFFRLRLALDLPVDGP